MFLLPSLHLANSYSVFEAQLSHHLPQGKKRVSQSERVGGKQGVQIGRAREQEAELERQGVGRGEERQHGKIGRKEKTERS